MSTVKAIQQDQKPLLTLYGYKIDNPKARSIPSRVKARGGECCQINHTENDDHVVFLSTVIIPEHHHYADEVLGDGEEELSYLLYCLQDPDGDGDVPVVTVSRDWAELTGLDLGPNVRHFS